MILMAPSTIVATGDESSSSSSCTTSNNIMREGIARVRGGGGDGIIISDEVKAAAFATSSTLRRLWRRPPLASSSLLGGSSATPALSSSIDDSYSSYQGELQTQHQQPMIPRKDEPNLYNIPLDLYPTYRPMPLILRLILPIISSVIVANRYRYSLPMRWSDVLSPLNSRRLLLSTPVIRITLSFLLRSVLLWTLATLSIQEYYFPPSQITTTSLAQAGHLPSTLSRYSVVTPQPEVGREEVVEIPVIPIGVHSIRYTKRGTTGITDTTSRTLKKYDGISFYHGFGASSLSWLPVLPTLVERLGSNKGRHSVAAAVGVAHDAIGFGFTDRPNGDDDGGLRQYSSENSANIGLALLVESLSEQQQQDSAAAAMMSSNDDVIEEDTKSIAIFGHSMGARAALLMAYQCATDPTLKLRPNLIVLVAPALEGVTLPSVKRVGYHVKMSRRQSLTWSLAGRVWIMWRKVFVDPPLRYVLRRLVCGTKDFWRNGLVLAWGDPRRLSDSDVLRFQWPSVGRGWEGGILNFARSRILSSPHPGTLDDVRLLREVTNNEKDIRVVIVYGSRDGIVRIDSTVAERVCKDFPNIKFIRMEGCGHDPFEEDVQGFVTVIEKSLECE